MRAVDVDNSAHFATCTLEGDRGSGVIQINGAARRLVGTGDKPTVVHVDRMNVIVNVDDAVG